ncbi:MAG: DUF4097 family beta strand repeat-containing protein [Eubacteriales bacterium]|nr:DUF4097 family beta strand repeat-containing protein [Eubacteriales bacterium]
MKSNIIYIVGALILIAGISLLVVGFAMTGFDMNAPGNAGTYTEKTYEAPSPGRIQTIEIEDSNTVVEIIRSTGRKLRINYHESEDDYYDIYLNGDVLRCRKQNSAKWYQNFFRFDTQKRSLVLSIPAGFGGDISVKTSNAAIDVSDIDLSQLRLRSSNGRIKAGNVKAGLIDADTSNSGIDLRRSEAEEIVCRTSNGKIELDDVGGDDIRAESSNGSIIIHAVSARDINIRTSNGKIEFDDIKITSELSMTNSNGSIRGRVDGRMSDFTIRTKTSNASNNLPEDFGSGGKKLTASTSNGAIDIEFTGD